MAFVLFNFSLIIQSFFYYVKQLCGKTGIKENKIKWNKTEWKETKRNERQRNREMRWSRAEQKFCERVWHTSSAFTPNKLASCSCRLAVNVVCILTENRLRHGRFLPPDDCSSANGLKIWKACCTRPWAQWGLYTVDVMCFMSFHFTSISFDHFIWFHFYFTFILLPFHFQFHLISSY